MPGAYTRGEIKSSGPISAASASQRGGQTPVPSQPCRSQCVSRPTHPQRHAQRTLRLPPRCSEGGVWTAEQRDGDRVPTQTQPQSHPALTPHAGPGAARDRTPPFRTEAQEDRRQEPRQQRQTAASPRSLVRGRNHARSGQGGRGQGGTGAGCLSEHKSSSGGRDTKSCLVAGRGLGAQRGVGARVGWGEGGSVRGRTGQGSGARSAGGLGRGVRQCWEGALAVDSVPGAQLG